MARVPDAGKLAVSIDKTQILQCVCKSNKQLLRDSEQEQALFLCQLRLDYSKVLQSDCLLDCVFIAIESVLTFTGLGSEGKRRACT